MHWDHIIKNGTIVQEEELFEGNIYIKDGKIAAISSTELAGETVEETDATGLHVFPGFMDVHIHSRDPGATHKEDFYHSTWAAAAGGLTTVFEMPNTNPPVNHVENFHKQVENLQPKAHVDFALWAICLGHLNINEIQSLHEAGAVAFKFFWGYAVHKKTYQLMYNYKPEMEDVIPPFQDGEVYDMFQEVAKTGKPFAIHAENNELIQHLTQKVEESGRRDYGALLQGRPNLAEATTIQTGISFAKDAGTRLHVLHVSTEEGVELIRQAQQEGYPITSETCPHFLYLSNKDFEKIGPHMKVYPPVKYEKDQNGLWKGIADGVVSVACSDHAPHTEEEKDGDLWSIPAGMCGVETLAPLMIHAVSEGRITPYELGKLLSSQPARLFGIYPQKGSLQIGTDADLTLVDFKRQKTIHKHELHSKSKVTPYDGFQLQGAPVATIVRGTTMMKDGAVTEEPAGRVVKP
ncbi:dihydroorotase [Natribacillus halophilus]|uniref:Dihydroorotase n=1 Tax=Natribacillus halophilus TaxID=549003 RepID=A0A1G8JX99_9BACI|nr:dihydroorotase family protein [Natribacillus halophilus]SDI35836.1 dihydroorotase [Natribacillus halophilus]